MKKNTAVVEFTHLFDKRGAKLLTGKTMIKRLSSYIGSKNNKRSKLNKTKAR